MGLTLRKSVSDVCVCMFYVSEVTGFVDCLDRGLIYMWEEFRNVFCLWPEFHCPEVTLCGWQDIKIQLLLLLLVCKWRRASSLRHNVQLLVRFNGVMYSRPVHVNREGVFKETWRILVTCAFCLAPVHAPLFSARVQLGSVSPDKAFPSSARLCEFLWHSSVMSVVD